MQEFHKLEIDGQSVRFIENGQIFLLDAIQVISDTNRPEVLWNNFKQTIPGIEKLFDEVELSSNKSRKPVPVVNSENWETIFVLLYDYLISKGENNIS